MKVFKHTSGILLLLSMFVYNHADGQHEITIDVDFPGGNIIVENNDNISTLYYDVIGDTVFVRPDLRDTEGNWFYWYFRVTGAANKTLHFQFPGRHVSSFGPAYLSDRSGTWQWLYNEVQDSHNNFTYSFSPSENEVRFSSTIPYLQADFEDFVSSYVNNPYVTFGTLTTSEKGRNVEKMYIRHPENDSKYKVLLAARNHAGESIASYALEGFIESILEEEDSSQRWLRENVEFLIVPFMDKDGVEDGDQGKNRRPHDHNRDYSGESIYNSVASLRETVSEWSKGQLKVALDFHCPYIVGGDWNEIIYFVGSSDEKIAKEQKKYVDILVRRHIGELTIHPARSLLEFGTAWNVSASYSQGFSFSRWAATIDGVFFSSTLEIPFSNNDGQKITPQNARQFGKDMADAISIYLQGM